MQVRSPPTTGVIPPPRPQAQRRWKAGRADAEGQPDAHAKALARHASQQMFDGGLHLGH
jgi:hypothetical protein